jgi:hypothetical protein
MTDSWREEQEEKKSTCSLSTGTPAGTCEAMTVQLLVQATMMRERQATMTEERLRLESNERERKRARERELRWRTCAQLIGWELWELPSVVWLSQKTGHASWALVFLEVNFPVFFFYKEVFTRFFFLFLSRGKGSQYRAFQIWGLLSRLRAGAKNSQGTTSEGFPLCNTQQIFFSHNIHQKNEKINKYENMTKLGSNLPLVGSYFDRNR